MNQWTQDNDRKAPETPYKGGKAIARLDAPKPQRLRLAAVLASLRVNVGACSNHKRYKWDSVTNRRSSCPHPGTVWKQI